MNMIKKDDDIISDDDHGIPQQRPEPWHQKFDKLLPYPILLMKRKTLKLKKDFGFIPFIIFFFLKILCSLVMLNFWMASHLSVIHLEDRMPLLRVHRDGNKDIGSIDRSRNIKNTTLYAARNPVSMHSIIESNNTTSAIDKKKVVKNNTSNNNTPKKSGVIIPNLEDGTLQGKERLWNILQTRNVTQVDADYWKSIPTWDTIQQNIHNVGSDNNSPIIHGLETCESFQKITEAAPSQRRIAPAGLFNTGTNYLSVLLEYNCQNPHRVEKFHGNAKRGHGNEWEVPWGKHTPASSRGNYFKNPNLKYTVDEILPIVLIRNPFGWMKSMCRNPYTAKWKGIANKKTCPQLKTKEGYNPVDATFGSGPTHHQSLAHMYNDWYGEYFYNKNSTTTNSTTDAPFPRLMIRFEDIIYFPFEVTKTVCECAGGVLGHRQDDKDVAKGTFHYVVRSAKAGFGHGPAEHRNGLIDSWSKYGGSDPKDDYTKEEIDVSKMILDPLLLETFQYR